MTAINLVNALRQGKFQPFDLCLKGGKVIPVKQRDCVLFSNNKTVIVVSEGEHFHIVDLDQISKLSMKKQ